MNRNRHGKQVISTICVVFILLAGIAGVATGWNGKDKPVTEVSEDGYEYTTVMDESDIGLLTGEDPFVEIQMLMDAYYGNGKLVMYTGTMRLLDDNEETQRLLEEHRFEYSVCGRSFYYKLGQMECISKEKLLIMIDHTEKAISFSQNFPSSGKTGDLIDMELFKKLMSENKADVKVSQLGDEKILTVNNISDPSIHGYQVFYDPENYQIRKILIGMIRLSPLEDGEGDALALNEEDRDSNTGTGDESAVEGYSYILEIIYEKTIRSEVSVKEFSPERKFIKLSAGKVEASEAYKNYEIVQ